MKTVSSNTDASIFEVMRQQVELRPHAAALISEKFSLTFAHLGKFERMLCQFLWSKGVSRKDRVLILMPRGIEMGLLSIGVMNRAIGVPVNPDFTISEIDELLGAIKPKIILTSPSVDKTWIDCQNLEKDTPVVDVAINAEELKWEFNGQSFIENHNDHDNPLPKPEDIALMLLTSGSTSTPKLVPLSHKNISQASLNLIDSLQISDSDRCLNTMTMFHVGGLLDMLITPLSIGSTVICPEEKGSEAFFSHLTQFNPTWYQAVPAMLLDIMAFSELNNETVSADSALRFIRSVSSPLSAELFNKVESFFGVPVIEIYGMTETAGVIASNPLPPESRKPLSVGKIVGNTEVKIIDGHNNPLDASMVGEIIVSSDAVFSGYLTEKGVNRDQFIGNWFKTGDTGFLDDDGYLFLKGRVKDIINRGGEKISPLEIDRMIETHPAVLEAASFAIDHPSLGEEVAAAIVLKPSMKLDKEELRSFLAQHLAPFKHPQELIFLNRLPRNSGGKVQRHLLAQGMSGQSRKKSTIDDSPETELEKIVAGLWKKILNVQQVQKHDNFFELGGDSLRATLFIAQLEKKISRELDARVIYETPVLTAFCSELEALSLYKPKGVTVRTEALRKELKRLMAFWPGSRLNDDSLIVGHNVVGSKVPIFWCTNSLDHFVEQTKYFDADQPIYGMVSLMESKFRSVENNARVAEIYTEEILQLGANRKVIIGAWCEGAKIMIDTANQLEEKGIDVKLLFMQDNFIPKPFHKPVAFFFSNYAMNRYRDQYYNPDFGIGKYYSGGFTTHYDDIDHTAYYEDPDTMKKFVKDLNNRLTRVIEVPGVADSKSHPDKRQLLNHTDYKARVVLQEPPFFVDLDSDRPIAVEITNKSKTTWQAGDVSGITLMVTWLNFAYERLGQDGFVLPREVDPEQRINIPINFKPPEISGNGKLMFLQIDLVDDGVARFSSPASKAVRFPTMSAPLMLYPVYVHRGNSIWKKLEKIVAPKKLKPNSLPILGTNLFIKLIRTIRNLTYKYTNE